MTREIKFRGMDESTKKWVYGGYHKHQEIEICPVIFSGESKDDKEPKYVHYIIMDGFADWNLPKPILKCDVIPETVGQYTGLKDKNGKEIYEGDILSSLYKRDGCKGVYVVEFYLGNFYPNKHGKHQQPVGIRMRDLERCEVIGNVCENRELLENLNVH